MTRLLACGWETGHIDEVEHSWIATQVDQIASSTTPRNGDRCLQLAATSISPDGKYVVTLAASKTEIWTRFGFKPQLIGAHSASHVSEFLHFYDANGDEAAFLRYNMVTGIIEAVRGSTVIATSSTGLAVSAGGAWHLIEVRYKPSNSAGIIEVYLNGTLVLNFASGDSTNGLENVVGVGLSFDASNDYVNSPYGSNIHSFDDWVINDTAGSVNNGRPADGAVLMLQPTGAGSSTQLSRGGTDSGANWSQVDEIPPDDADYVYDTTVGDRDLYAHEDLPAGVGTIFSVQVIARAKEEISGVGQIGLTQKSGAVITEATAVALESTYKYYRDLREVNPETSAAYTVAGVNALEAGVTVR